MNAIQKAVTALKSAVKRFETVKECNPEYAFDDDIRICNEALTALRGSVAVDVDEITRNVMKVFDGYKYGDSSRPHSFYDEKKPTLIWLIEHLHANGYLPNQWQDISTAPRDGANILAWNHNDLFDVQPYIAWWGQDVNTPDDDDNREEWLTGDGDDWSTGNYYTPCKPTHWMPLPKPPKNTKGDRNDA